MSSSWPIVMNASYCGSRVSLQEASGENNNVSQNKVYIVQHPLGTQKGLSTCINVQSITNQVA